MEKREAIKTRRRLSAHQEKRIKKRNILRKGEGKTASTYKVGGDQDIILKLHPRRSSFAISVNHLDESMTSNSSSSKKVGVDNSEGKDKERNKLKIKKTKITKNQNSKSVSIPIMITQEMRMRLKGLKYHMSDIRNLTPQQANDIIRNQIINKNISINHARNQ